MLGFVQRDARLLGAHWRGFPALTDLTDYFRLVLRTSRSTADAPPADAPPADAPPADAPPADAPPADAPPADAPTADARATRQVDCSPVQTSLGTPVATPHSRPVRAARRAKPVCALQPGDAIRLETGERVVVTYVCTGGGPGRRYIEWRGPLPSNWANLPLDALVVLG